MEFKKPLLPHPLLSPVGGGGKGVLGQQPYNFAELYLKHHQMLFENNVFSGNPLH
jgi:hypothetical protein